MTARMSEHVEKHARRIINELGTQRGARLVTSDEEFYEAVMVRVKAMLGGATDAPWDEPT